jgi:6-phosphogluconolactonase (cycloisomerase 2 family)
MRTETLEELSMASIRSLRGVAALVLVVSLAGCGGGGKGGTTNPPPTPRTIGGTVTGLTGTGLVLRNNGGDSLTVSGNGAFTFATSIAEGSAYAVTAFTQPSNPSQTCVVSNGSGTVGGSNVTNVQVACTTNTQTVGGTVSGLSGTALVLQNNGGNNLTISANGAFTFAAPIAQGSAYAITVAAQPTNPSQTCVVSNGSGTVAATDVTDVQVACSTNIFSFTVGGTVSGLTGSGLVLRNNGGANLGISSNGPFTFATSITQGNAYAVTAFAQPTNPSQTCVVSNGGGTVAGGNIIDVQVACTTDNFILGGNLSGLTGTGLVLSNGSERVTLNADGSFAFNTAISSGASYNVLIDAAPANPVQRCSVTNGSGTVTNANVNIGVTCVAVNPTYAYSVNRGDGTFSSYAIDAGTGQPRARHNAKAGTQPSAAVVYKPSNGEQFSLVVNEGSDNISVFATDKRSGALDEVAGSPFATGGDAPKSLVLHPTRPFFYAPNENGASIATFVIDEDTGVLTQTGPVATGTLPQSFVIEATGRFAYVAAPGSSELYTYAINQTTGALSEVASSRITFGTSVGTIALEREGRFLYAFNPTPGTISAYAIDPTSGALTAIAGSPFNAAANAALAGMHPNGRFMYVKYSVPLNNSANGLAAFAIDASTGALSEIAGSPFDTGVTPVNPVAMSFDPTGGHLYVGHLRGGGAPIFDVRGYTVDPATGALTAVPGSPFATPSFPSSLDVDGSGNYLYVTNQLADQVTAYSIGSLGELTQLPSASVNVGDSPVFITSEEETTPLQLSSKFVYAVDGINNLAHVFTINATGMLAPSAAPLATGSGAHGVTLDPKGRYAYIANTGVDEISIYSVDSTTGELTAIPANPVVSAGDAPNYIAIEPSGRYAYVAAAGSNEILQFTIDQDSGELTAPVSTSVVGQAMNVLRVAPNGRWLYATTTTDALVRRYAINSTTGQLGAVTTENTGGNVSSLALNAAGTFAYVTDATSGLLRTYSISSTTGSLTPVSTYPFTGDLPDGVAFDPLGEFAFTADGATNNTVSMFRILPNGAVTFSDSEVIAGTNPIAVATDYSGGFVCVVTANGEVYTYAIDRTLGTLTFVSSESLGGISNSGALTLSTHAE